MTLTENLLEDWKMLNNHLLTFVVKNKVPTAKLKRLDDAIEELRNVINSFEEVTE